MRSASVVAVLGAVGLSAATLTLALWPRPAPPARPAGPPVLDAFEQARAAALFARMPADTPTCVETVGLLTDRARECSRQGAEDIDHDGRADCWRATWRRRNELSPPVIQTTELTVWPGCAGPGITQEVDHVWTTELIPPASLAHARWLQWMAARFVGGAQVTCLDCTMESPEIPPAWQWVVDAAARHSTDPSPTSDVPFSDGWDGTIAPAWQPLPRPTWTPRALVLVHAPAYWHWHIKQDLEWFAGTEVAPRIVIDPGRTGERPSMQCGGLDVYGDPGGVLAVDPAHARWAWLFRGLPDFGGFDAHELLCEDGTIVAVEGGFYSGIAVIDPATGGWLYEPPTDYSRGASLRVGPDGSRLWHREPQETLSFRALQHWLATPVAARPLLRDAAIAERPELASVSAPQYDASDIVSHVPGGIVGADAIGPEARRGLVARGSCAGWQLSSSGTAVLAERDGHARWVAVEPLGSSRRYTEVRCAGTTIEITRFADTAVISDGTREDDVPDRLVVDLATATWVVPR